MVKKDKYTMTIPTEILRSDAIEWLTDSLGTDEPDILLDVIQTFRSDGANLVARMNDALHQNDDQILFRTAHTLKSSSSIVGADRLSGACETLEWALRRKQPLDFVDAVAQITDAFTQADQKLIIEIEKLESKLA